VPKISYTPGPFEVESYGGDRFEVVDAETLAITVCRLSGPRAAADAQHIKNALNSYEGVLGALRQIERLSREADGSLVDVRAMLGGIARAAIVKMEEH
jgi:hypothetical protein